MAVQFAKFGTVGTLGFLVDTSVVYGLRGAIGLYWAGLASYFVAATVTWSCNRLWTFRGIGSGPAHRQWMRFLGANSLGFMLNRGTYMLLITFVAACAHQPVLATAAGRDRRDVREFRPVAHTGVPLSDTRRNPARPFLRNLQPH